MAMEKRLVSVRCAVALTLLCCGHALAQLVPGTISGTARAMANGTQSQTVALTAWGIPAFATVRCEPRFGGPSAFCEANATSTTQLTFRLGTDTSVPCNTGGTSSQMSFRFVQNQPGSWRLTLVSGIATNYRMSVQGPGVSRTISFDSNPEPPVRSLVSTSGEPQTFLVNASCSNGNGQVVGTIEFAPLQHAHFARRAGNTLGPRFQHALSPALAESPWSDDDLTFVGVGGRDGSGEFVNHALRLAPPYTAWEIATATASPFPFAPRADHAMVETPNGTLVTGGKTAALVLSGASFTGGWASFTSFATPTVPARGGHTLTRMEKVPGVGANGQIVMIGGFTDISGPQAVYSRLAYRDGGVGWEAVSQPANMPARFAHAAAYDKQGMRVVVFGGYGNDGFLGDTWAWNGFAFTRIAAQGPGPSPRYYHTMQWDESRRGVLLVGGRNNSTVYGDQWLLAGDRWERVDEDFPGGPRWAHAAATNADGTMIVCGGYPNLSDTWVSTQAPVIRSQPSAVLVQQGGTAVFVVQARGTGVSYRWQRNGEDVANGPRVSGATTTILTLSDVQPGDAGSLRCVLTNLSGTTTTDVATLSVVDCDSIDFNRDGLFPDDADLLGFITLLAGGECSTGDCNDVDFNNDGLFPDDTDLVTFLRVLAGGDC